MSQMPLSHNSSSNMYKSIRQTVHFKTSPKVIYGMLMDQAKHATFTGSEVRISKEIGGPFSVWGGSLSGVQLELVPGKRIVQSWRADDWPAGHHSTATYELSKTDAGCTLVFTQTGVPVEHHASVNEGWRTFYWSPMKKALKG